MEEEEEEEGMRNKLTKRKREVWRKRIGKGGEEEFEVMFAVLFLVLLTIDC